MGCSLLPATGHLQELRAWKSPLGTSRIAELSQVVLEEAKTWIPCKREVALQPASGVAGEGSGGESRVILGAVLERAG